MIVMRAPTKDEWGPSNDLFVLDLKPNQKGYIIPGWKWNPDPFKCYLEPWLYFTHTGIYLEDWVEVRPA